jgi:hypothetical protein
MMLVTLSFHFVFPLIPVHPLIISLLSHCHRLQMPSATEAIEKDDTSSPWPAVTQHFLEIFVRAFYSPLLFCNLCDNLPMLHYKANETFSTYIHGFRYINNIVFTIDLSVAWLGYALPFSRLHGAHFKSTDSRSVTHIFFLYLLSRYLHLFCYHHFHSQH